MVVSLLSISLLACGSDLTDTSWRADAVYADDGTQVPIPSDSDITFAEDVLVGFASLWLSLSYRFHY